MLKFQIVFGVCIKKPFFFIFFWGGGGGGGGTPSDQIFWGYRANARAEPRCQEKFYYPLPPPPPLGCTPPNLCTFDKYFLISTCVELKHFFPPEMHRGCQIRLIFNSNNFHSFIFNAA